MQYTLNFVASVMMGAASYHFCGFKQSFWLSLYIGIVVLVCSRGSSIHFVDVLPRLFKILTLVSFYCIYRMYSTVK